MCSCKMKWSVATLIKADLVGVPHSGIDPHGIASIDQIFRIIEFIDYRLYQFVHLEVNNESFDATQQFKPC